MQTDPSAAPVRERGVRTRAGNAMGRTRAAVLDGAARAVEKHGARRATMADIASLAGIAKGTLYNHFRAKDAVYAAAVDAGVRTLAEECATVARDDLADALALAADRLATHPALRRLAADEPATLAALTGVGTGGGWDTARSAVTSVLEAAGRDGGPAPVEVALRWLVSFVGAAGVEVEAQARLLAAALPLAAAPESPAGPPAAAAPAVDGSPVPGAGSAVPGEGSPVPGEGSQVPGAGSQVPGEGSAVPGDGPAWQAGHQ